MSDRDSHISNAVRKAQEALGIKPKSHTLHPADFVIINSGTPTLVPSPAKPKKVVGLKNANSEIGINPKDKIGSLSVDFTLCPQSAYIEWALGHMDGATKYGPYNWRVEPIQARTYIAAAIRHLTDFLEDEQKAPDSGVHHLGHAMSCCAILIDAEACGTLIDDRPVKGNGSKRLETVKKWIKSTKPVAWGR